MQEPSASRLIGSWIGAAVLAGAFSAPTPAQAGATTAHRATSPSPAVSAPAGVAAGLDRLRDAVGATAAPRDEGGRSAALSESMRVGRASDGYVRSIGAPAGRSWSVSDARSDRDPSALAHGFMREHRALFGWMRRGTELRARSVRESRGRTFVRFEQRRDDLRIFGAGVVVQVEPSGGVGFVLADIARDAAALHADDFSTEPDVGEASASAAALDLVAAVRGAVDAGAGPPQLMIFEPSVMGLSGRSRLVWSVRARDAAGPVDEVVLVDTRSGEVAFHYSEVMNDNTCWFSDILGELVDPTNGGAGDPRANRGRVGEGRRFNPLWCMLAEDEQGVHISSGVVSKLAFLLSDGGTFNGQTVIGLGFTAVAELFHEAQAHLLLPASAYSDLDVALVQAAVNLAWPPAAQDSLRRAQEAVEIAGGPHSVAALADDPGSTRDTGTVDTVSADTAVVPYVSTAGSDGNDGRSEGSPWKSLLYAEAQATQPGSIIALKRGDVFVMSSALGLHHGGASGAPIVWDGGLWGEGSNAVIRAGNDREAGDLSVVNIIGASYVTFQNITVDGNDKNAFGLVVGGTDSYCSPGGYQDSETSIVIQDSEFINCGTALHDYVIGVLFQTWNNDMSDITFRRNRVDRASNHTVAAYCGRPEHGATPSKLRGITIAHNEVSNFGLNGQDHATGILFTRASSTESWSTTSCGRETTEPPPPWPSRARSTRCRRTP